MANSLCPIVVGRDLELAALTRALDVALDGSGGVVLITGEAGIGKSRLAAETVAAARQRGAVGVTGRAAPSGTASPYLPITEALLQALRDRAMPDDADFAAWRPLLGAVLSTLGRPTSSIERSSRASPANCCASKAASSPSGMRCRARRFSTGYCRSGGRAIAAAALAALDADPGRAERELAADLAAQAGDDARAGALLTESGQAALARGALATAIDTLRRAHALGDAGADLPLVRALALAGHVDETVAVGEQVAASSCPPSERLAIELEIAHAAVAAARSQLAKEHIERARALAADDANTDARLAVLEAEVALAADDTDRAAALVSPVVDGRVAAPIRCQAWEIRGRVARFTDHMAARECFEQARVLAERAQLPFWRLRALHELGTIDMFESAGADLLLQSRAAAQELGAPGLVAVLDLQLTAAYHCRFELASANEHARSALRLSDQLGLDLARTKALVMLAENASWRGDRARFDEFSGQARAASPDPAIAAFLTGGRAMYERLYGDRARAIDAFHRAAQTLDGLPHAEPAAFRAIAPVVLASAGDRRAAELLAAARRSGVGSFGMNRGLLDGAAAILAGRAGNVAAARRWVDESAAAFVNCTAWSELVRWLAAESAAAEGWDQPGWWADGLAARLAARGLVRPADRCRALTEGPERWAVPGITAREADVLSLLVADLSNRDIALQLHVSPRTVEKHVEALLRKLDVRSRTQLVSAALRQATT